VEYVLSHEDHDRDGILTFLFQLSYCRPGSYYPVEALTKVQRRLLDKFMSFGLIYRRSETSSRFYPTNVAINLIFGASGIRAADQENVPRELRLLDPNQLTVIVETNYQVGRAPSAGDATSRRLPSHSGPPCPVRRWSPTRSRPSTTRCCRSSSTCAAAFPTW
jgi:hypothetical protein